jgi:D-tagatose-1,6-bisphosphate aldolase subunit GatZ/KbaZ
MLQAKRDESLLLIESTSNQVNQFGGYTGQTPAQFAEFVLETAAAMKFPKNRIVLGGDHLGPHVWRKEPSAPAMEKAKEMVGAYVRAGFTKIHLDASMPCADDKTDPGRPLTDEVVSARSAELCVAAEQAFRERRPTGAAPLYVIGTEVPIPGGEEFGSNEPDVTKTKDLSRTLQIARQAFVARGLDAAWDRVIAVVVQPGVEFGDSTVFPYEPRKAKPLSRFFTRDWKGVYEAHSTDYQTRNALRQMVMDHFAILKVGPWLTFAFREAIFALAAIEKEWLAGRSGVSLSGLPEILETAMLGNPVYWKSYYHGDEDTLRIARKYSFSDRVRYYWPQPTVSEAVQRLIANLTSYPPPASLLSQFLPVQLEAIRAAEIPNEPVTLIRHKILKVLDHYAYACGMIDVKKGGDGARGLC